MADFRELAAGIMDACKSVFGESTACVHKPQVGSQQSFTGIFLEQSAQVDGLSGIAVNSLQPRLGAKLSDLNTVPTQGDVFTVRGSDYKLVDIQKDGLAGVIFLLHKKT